MHDISTRYSNHVLDIYGSQVDGVPEVDYGELVYLTDKLRHSLQPILLWDSREQQLAQLQGQTHILRDGKSVFPYREIERLREWAKSAEKEAIGIAYQVAEKLDLDELVELETDEGINVSDLRKISKTVHWLYRNLRE